MQMPSTKNITGACAGCGAPLEFPAENLGQTMVCPVCRQETELMLATPKPAGAVPRWMMIWALVGILILVFGLAAALLALKRAERWAARHKAPAEQATKP